MRDKERKTGLGKLGERVPAIALGTGLTTLGVIRCLGRKGIPAYSISAEPEIEIHSRWCRDLTDRVGPLDDVSGLITCLSSLPFDRAVLIPCSDHWASEIARLPEDLGKRFPSGRSSCQVNQRFIEKRKFLELAREARIPHPRSEPVNSADELAQMLKDWDGGCFLKPSNSQLFHRRFGRKAIYVDSVRAALAQYTVACREGLDFILQEYIPGGPRNHHFIDGYVDEKHDVVTCFARQRLRMHPRDFGNSSYMVSEALERVEPAVQALKMLFKTAGYRGIFSAEFKKDERDGSFQILEVNCRPWWYVEFAATCGVDVIELAYLDALGQPWWPPGTYDVGVSFVYPYYDYQAIRNLPSDVRPGFFGWLGTVLRSKQPIACWDDPIPWVAGVGSMLSRRLNRCLRGLERRK